MLRIIILLRLVLVAFAAPEGRLINLSPDPFRNIVNGYIQCAPENEVEDILKLVREGKWREDGEFKNIVYCMFEAAGFTIDDNPRRLDIEKMLLIFDRDEVNNAIRDCHNNNPDMLEFFKCFQKESPLFINVHTK